MTNDAAWALVGLIIVFLGCGPTWYINHRGPSAGQLEFDKDIYECRRENTKIDRKSVV